MTPGARARTLQETLETEYPLLDSSLLAAFISDLPSEADPSHESVRSLQHTLAELSLEADSNAYTLSEGVLDHFESDDLLGSERSTSIVDDTSLSASAASSSSTQATSAASCSSAQDFLRILFPHLSISLLRQAINECNDAQDLTGEPDLSAVVDHLLTLEYIQDLAERGLEEDAEVESGTWVTVTTGGTHRTEKPKTKSRVYKRTIPLVDVRQRQHVHRAPTVASTVSSSLSDDPWTRLTSLATRLGELLQPTPPGFFMSYFHSPATKSQGNQAQWKGEGDAVRDALSDLAKRTAGPVKEDSVEIAREIVLGRAHESHFNATRRAKLVADSSLCVTAAQGDISAAIDLVWLLDELDREFSQGGGVAHAVDGEVILNNGNPMAMSAGITRSPPTRSPTSALPAHPPLAQPPQLSSKQLQPMTSSHTDRGWTLVEPRRHVPEKFTHAHAEFIPAYANHNSRARRFVKSGENQFRKGGNGDMEVFQMRNVAWYQARAAETQKQRNEALREAMRHWQIGNAKSRGGEVAMYYAEKARELKEQQKQWTLGAARVMVEEKRMKNSELDLHGLTVAEACVIVTEALAATPPTPNFPLKIITGRGRHSAGRVGVLGPAVHEMLRSANWRVGAWDGGLIVSGRT